MHSVSIVAALLLSGFAEATPLGLKKRFTGPSDPDRFTFYTVPSAFSLGVICDSDTGPDGETLWYQDFVGAIMGYLNYKVNKPREPCIGHADSPFDRPGLLPGNITGLQCVTRTGLDGMVYGGSGIRNEIVQVDPRTNPPKLQIFTPVPNNPLGDLQPFNDAWGAHDGLYFSQTTADKITKFDYGTQAFTSYDVPTKLSGVLGMRTDKNQNLWVTMFVGQFLGVLNHTTKQGGCPLPGGLFPEVLRSSTENQKYLWANAFGFGGYIRIEPGEPDDAKKFQIFTNPTLGAPLTLPFENVNDFCGRIWYTSPSLNVLVYYTPSTNIWTTVVVPGLPLTGNFEVTMHRGPGHNLWFTLGTIGQIVRYELDSDCYGQAQ